MENAEMQTPMDVGDKLIEIGQTIKDFGFFPNEGQNRIDDANGQKVGYYLIRRRRLSFWVKEQNK